jgi:hypothetical protein
MSSTKRLVLYSCKGKTSKYKDNERSVDLTSQLARYYINEVEDNLSYLYIAEESQKSYIQKVHESLLAVLIPRV